MALARFTTTGAFDPTFGTGGKVMTAVQGDDYGYGVALQADGRIVVGGASYNPTADMLALRYNPDGSLDATFGSGGKAVVSLYPAANDGAYAVAVQPDGNIVLAGWAASPGGNDFAVVRLLGGPDDLLVNGGFESAEALGGGVATGFGDWRQDVATTVTGTQNGITPYQGTRMVRFDGTTDSGAQAGNFDGDISQYVDLSSYAAPIAQGQVTVTVSARFNRVAGNANTDTEFRLLLIAGSGALTTIPNLGTNTVSLISDANPATWELLTNTWKVPAGATWLFVNPYARENVSEGGTAPEFDGHYLDDVRMSLSGPSDFWFVQVFQDLAAYPAVTNLVTAEALIASNARIAQGSVAQADLLGFSATLPAGRFPFDLPMPGNTGNRNNYAVKATAQFWVATAGNYTFAAHTDDGVRVRIDGQVVITDDGMQNARDSQYAVVNLTAGAHTIEWVWFEHLGEDEGELFAAPGVRTGFDGVFKLVGDARLFGLPAGIVPEIAVEQPAGTNLVDGVATVNFGTLAGPSSVATRIFTVRNTGTRQLTGLDFLFDGPDAARFSIAAPPVAPVLPGGSTTFTLRFAPGAAGPRSATLRMTSNDADENPFDLALAGNAFSSIEEWRNTYFGTTANTGNAANAADPDGDGDLNIFEFAHGTNPTVSDGGVLVVSGAAILQRGSPTVWLQKTLYGVDYRALFGRRKDYLVAGLAYTVQFSRNLTTWETSTATPTVVAADAVMDAVTVPYPFFLSTGEKAQFFRVVLTGP